MLAINSFMKPLLLFGISTVLICVPARNLNWFYFFQVSLLEESGAFDKALEELHRKDSKIVSFLKLIVMIYLGHRIQAYSGFTFLLWLYM